jgi:hypothetical protein
MSNKTEQSKIKAKTLKQVPIRLHVNDYRAMKKLFVDEGWNFQKFVSACVESYLRRDPLLLRTIEEWKVENAAPQRANKSGDVFTHSRREANDLLDEIEALEDELE